MVLSLRPVDDGDEDFLFWLYASTRQEEIAAWGWDTAQRDAFLRMQFQAQRNSYRAAYPTADHSVVVVDGTSVGRLIVSSKDKSIVLVDISLLSEYRNRGIGTELMQRLLREAETSRCSLSLQAARNNRAIQLYERLGFKLIGADEVYCRMEWHPQSGGETPTVSPQSEILREEPFDRLDRRSFDLQLHTDFKLSAPGGQTLTMQLIEVIEGLSTPAVKQFSLLFRGPKDHLLQQGTFPVEHGEIGKLSLFIVPIGQDSNGITYQLVFSRFSNNS